MNNNYNNQTLAYEKFKQLKVGALLMKMGTGKTKIAIDLINYNIEKINKILYFTPFSSIENIKNEFVKWDKDLLNKTVFIGYETLQSSDKKYLELLKISVNNTTFIICDESIFIKNDETKRFQRLLELSKNSEYRLILNGTPITKNLWDIYNQIYFLSPLIINMNRQEFQNIFFKKIIYKRKGEKEKSFYQIFEKNVGQLNKLIGPYVFECDLTFDKKITGKKINISVDKKTNEQYCQAKEIGLKNTRNYNESVIIRLIMSLHMINSLDQCKAEEIALNHKNEQCIIYCNYIEELKNITEKLNGDCYIIRGEIKEREIVIEQFKQDNKPLLITFGTGSYSLNLQFCNKIVFASRNFDFSKQEQAKARIKRMNQERDIEYYIYRTNLKIENLIDENLEKKTILSELIKQKFIDNRNILEEL